MTQEALNLQFKDRPLVWMNQGVKTLDILYYAIPITVEELVEIKKVKQSGTKENSTNWKNIEYSEMLLVGNPHKAPPYIEQMLYSEEVGLPIQSPRLINQTPREIVKAYYYPPAKSCRQEEHNLIVFEDYRVAWNYYINILTSRDVFNNVLIIRFKN